MHIKIKNKKAVIEFESSGTERASHLLIIDELVHLVQDHFKEFVFDFSNLNMSFNSTISGFLLGVVRKLLENGATITFQNISDMDVETLRMIGIDQIEGKINYILR